MNSLPSIERANLEKYWDVVRRLEPEFFLIRVALKETGVNPLIIPRFIRALSNLAIGTGYGKVQIFVQNKVVTIIEGVDSDKIDEKVLVEED